MPACDGAAAIAPELGHEFLFADGRAVILSHSSLHKRISASLKSFKRQSDSGLAPPRYMDLVTHRECPSAHLGVPSRESDKATEPLLFDEIFRVLAEKDAI